MSSAALNPSRAPLVSLSEVLEMCPLWLETGPVLLQGELTLLGGDSALLAGEFLASELRIESIEFLMMEAAASVEEARLGL